MNNIYAEHEILKANFAKLMVAHEELLQKYTKGVEELAWFKRQMFGSKSERFVSTNNDQLALSLCNAEEEKIVPESAQKVESYERTTSSPEKKGHGRCPIPAHIKRIDTVLEPSDDISGLVKIGEDITEELEFIPPTFVVNRTIRPKYAKADGSATVVVADLPRRLIEKGRPGSGLLAQVAMAKHVDHIPLYRQSKQYERSGIKISRSTLDGWMGDISEKIKPICKLLQHKTLDTKYIQADETPILILEENPDPHKGKKDQKKTCHGYFWPYLNPEKRIMFFDFQNGRGRDGPEQILKGFKGILQTDAYGVYESLSHLRNAGKDKPDIVLSACLTHVRRKFNDAIDNDRQRADTALNIIKRLYLIEAEARDKKMTSDERYNYRIKMGAPIIMAEFKEWLTKQTIDMSLLPQSLIGKAISHALDRWTALQTYLTDGRIEIDNNLIENSIRPVALGRKNWLFCGSIEGAKRTALILSLVGTCKLQDIEPFGYLRNLFEKLPTTPEEQLQELLPIK